jgi:hypothetical protein
VVFLAGGFAGAAPGGRGGPGGGGAREEAFQAVALGGGDGFGVVVRKVSNLEKRVVLLGQGRESLLSPAGAALAVMQPGRCCWCRCLGGVDSRRKQAEAGNREDTGQAQRGDGKATTDDQIEDQEDKCQDTTGDEGTGRNRYIQ